MSAKGGKTFPRRPSEADQANYSSADPPPKHFKLLSVPSERGQNYLCSYPPFFFADARGGVSVAKRILLRSSFLDAAVKGGERKGGECDF